MSRGHNIVKKFLQKRGAWDNNPYKDDKPKEKQMEPKKTRPADRAQSLAAEATVKIKQPGYNPPEQETIMNKEAEPAIKAAANAGSPRFVDLTGIIKKDKKVAEEATASIKAKNYNPGGPSDRKDSAQLDSVKADTNRTVNATGEAKANRSNSGAAETMKQNASSKSIRDLMANLGIENKPAVQEAVAVNAEPPFDKPYKKTTGTITDKSGAKHSPMSKARDLARKGMAQMLKLNPKIGESWSDAALDQMEEGYIDYTRPSGAAYDATMVKGKMVITPNKPYEPYGAAPAKKKVTKLPMSQAAGALAAEAVTYTGMGTDVVDKKKKLNPQPALTMKPKQVKDYMEEVELDESLITGTKKISTHEAGQHKAEVRHNSEYNEFQVHYYKDGKHRGEGPVSYHENDRADATASAKREIERLGKTQKEEVELDESSGLPYALHQMGKNKWHIHNTNTQKLHSTYNNKNVAMKKYIELNNKDEKKADEVSVKIANHLSKFSGITKEEVEEITEGKMKEIYTDMQDHAAKKGYSSHKQFTPADYDAVGKQHGISGKELAVIAGHKTAAQVTKEKNLDELKLATMQRYADKAHQQAMDATYDAAHFNRPGEEKLKADAKRMASKRAGGVQLAQTKMDRMKENLESVNDVNEARVVEQPRAWNVRTLKPAGHGIVGKKVRSYDFPGIHDSHYVEGHVTDEDPQSYHIRTTKVVRHHKEEPIPAHLIHIRAPKGLHIFGNAPGVYYAPREMKPADKKTLKGIRNKP